jgi:hypothetical protein
LYQPQCRGQPLASTAACSAEIVITIHKNL